MKKIVLPALLLIAGFLIACNNNGGKSQKDLIVGRWEFYKSEKKGEEPELEREGRKRSAEFLAGGKFVSHRETSEGEDDRDDGTYQFSDDGKYLITRMNEREDKLRVLELNETTMRLETDDQEVVTLKRMH